MPLTDIENHRLDIQKERSLSIKLVVVKATLALYPLFYTAFLKRFIDYTCGENIDEVAGKIYGDRSDMMLPHLMKASPVPEGVFDSPYCMGGCYPDDCAEGAQSERACVTNCMWEIQKYLLTYFFSYVAIDIFFLVVPLFTRCWDVRQEKKKAREVHPGNEKDYTYCEMQAKSPKYEYNSWGGGPVDDFLEFAIMFAVIICFGVTFPIVFLIAAITFLLMYRLMAFRLVYVTQRPFPLHATSIGVWDGIFTSIGTIAIMTNVGTICFVMYPLRVVPLWWEILAFILVEHVLFALVYFLNFALFPEVPADVEVVEAANHDFLTENERHHVEGVDLQEDSKYDMYPDEIDLNLVPGSVESKSVRRRA